jgi:hypothetical protein
MSPRTVRRLVIVVFVAGIAGMIVGSIADNNGMAVTFGLVTAAAALGLILVTAVADPSSLGSRRGAVDDDAAASVEEQVDRLVTSGADEHQVRELVRRAVSLGRRSR